MRLPILYKQTGKKVMQWTIWTEGAAVIVVWSKLGGKLQRKRYDAKPKNVGKANETDAAAQAVVEAKAKWRHQIFREDYAQVPGDSNKQNRPMLAHDYNKVPHRVRWDAACTQPKLDGLRLVYGPRWPTDATHWSRQGLSSPTGPGLQLLSRKGDVYNLPHLHDELTTLWDLLEATLPEGTPLHGIDGEIYLHGLSLQEIVKRAKKDRGAATMELEFHAFDIIVPETHFVDRYDALATAYKGLAFDKLKLVPTYWSITGHKDVLAAHGQYVMRGFEGAIIRHADGYYEKGRSANLFKFKTFFDEECEIVNVWKDKNDNAMLTVKRDNGVLVDVTPKRTHAERKAMLEGNVADLMGKYITVKYQAETEDGSLQFPVGLGIREVSNGEPVS